MSKGIEIIEAKLELGITHYTDKEVAFLLNQIRVLTGIADRYKTGLNEIIAESDKEDFYTFKHYQIATQTLNQKGTN